MDEWTFWMGTSQFSLSSAAYITSWKIRKSLDWYNGDRSVPVKQKIRPVGELAVLFVLVALG